MTRRAPRARLGEVLVRLGVAEPGVVEAALEEQRRDGGRLGTVLLMRGSVRAEGLRAGLAAHYGMGTIHPGDLPVPLLPSSRSRQLGAVAVDGRRNGSAAGAIPVAFANPTRELVAAAKRELGRSVHPLVVDDATFDEMFQQAYPTRNGARPTGELAPVTLVVPLHRERPAALRRLWGALAALDYPATLLRGLALVAEDDWATEASIAELAPAPWLQLLRVPAPARGARRALALHGVRAARGSVIAVVDALAPPAPEFIHELVSGATAPKRRTVWVCVPTYNEAEQVERLSLAVLAKLDEAQIDGRVLIIDDGSPDGTGEIAEAVRAREPRVHVLHRPRKEGIGPAYLAGFAHALDQGADLVVEMDCDFSHDPAVLPRLVEAATEADLVLGSRYVPGGGVVDWPLPRRIVSRGGCWYARRLLSVDLHDLTGGFKCFRREVLEPLVDAEVHATGYGFQIEMTYRALLAGHTVREIPITFRDRTAGESKMSPAIALEAAVTVMRLRRARRRLAPAPTGSLALARAQGAVH
jgi:dolichol-phosphate mannosyltransferase